MPSFFSRLKSVFTGKVPELIEMEKQVAEVNEAFESYKASREMPAEVEAMEAINPADWGLRRASLVGDFTMPGSGYAYVMQPYATRFQMQWGIERPPDYEKLRKMYLWVTDYHRATDEMINMSVMKPYTFVYQDKKIGNIYKKLGIDDKKDEDPRKALIDELLELVRTKTVELDERIKTWQHIGAYTKDVIVLGNGFLENTMDDEIFEETFARHSQLNGTAQVMGYYNNFEQRNLREVDLWYWHTSGYEEGDEVKKFDKIYKGIADDMLSPFEETKKTTVNRIINSRRLNGIKNLDPDFMRVRRDAYGTVHGYVQILGWPPVIFNTDQIVHCKWMPSSWGQESTYGNSHYQSGIRNQEMLWQLENDGIIYSHNLVRFPGKLKNGIDPNREPASQRVWTAIKAAVFARKVSSDIALDANVDFEPFQMAKGAAAPVQWWMDYFKERRTINLGVPPVALGMTETGGGGSETNKRVSWNAFIVRLKTIQEVVGNSLIEHTFTLGIEQEIICDLEDIDDPSIDADKKYKYEWGKRVKEILDKLKLDCMTTVKRNGLDTQIWEFPLWLMPDMQFEEIGREDKDRLIQRGMAMKQMNLFTPNEIRSDLGWSDIPKDAGMDGDTIPDMFSMGGMGSPFGSGQPMGAERENEKARYKAKRSDVEDLAIASLLFDDVKREIAKRD
jgi:hypothetical protein